MSSAMESITSGNFENAYIASSSARPCILDTSSSEHSTLLANCGSSTPHDASPRTLYVGLEYDSLHVAVNKIQHLNFLQYQGQRRLQVQGFISDNSSVRLVCEYHPWCQYNILLQQVPSATKYCITEAELSHHAQCDSLLHEAAQQQSIPPLRSASYCGAVTPAHVTASVGDNYYRETDYMNQAEINNVYAESNYAQQAIRQPEHRKSPNGTTLAKDYRSAETQMSQSADVDQLSSYRSNRDSGYYPIENNGLVYMTPSGTSRPQYFEKSRPALAAGGNALLASNWAKDIVSSMMTPVAASAVAYTPATATCPDDSLSIYSLSTDTRWDTAKDAARAIYDYASKVQKKATRIDKRSSGGRNKKYVCACSSCGWFVRLLKVMKTEQWKISSMQLRHSTDCISEHAPTAWKVGSSAIHSNDTCMATTPKTPNSRLHSGASTSISADDDPISQSFGVLVRAFMNQYPDSYVAIRKQEQEGRLSNICIVPGWVRKNISSYQNVYGIEIISCCAPKNESAETKFGPRHFVCLIGKNGNFEPCMLALGFILAVTDEHVQWYIQELEMAGFLFNATTILTSFSQEVIINSFKYVFPHVKIQFCSDSLQNAIQNDLGISLSNEMVSAIREQIEQARIATNSAHYQKHIDIIASISPGAASFLQQLNPSEWVAWMNYGSRTYQWTTTCLSEYLQLPLPDAEHNNSSDPHFELRAEMLPLLSVTDIMRRFLADICNRQRMRSILLVEQIKMAEEYISTSAAKDILDARMLLTPNALKVIEQECMNSSSVHVQTVEAHVAFVYPPDDSDCPHRVNLTDETCSCAFTFQVGLPCRHFIAVARTLNCKSLSRLAVDRVYTIEAFSHSCDSGQRRTRPHIDGTLAHDYQEDSGEDENEDDAEKENQLASHSDERTLSHSDDANVEHTKRRESPIDQEFADQEKTKKLKTDSSGAPQDDYAA